MKRKFTAVLLCISLILALAVNVSALEVDLQQNNGITINVDENGNMDAVLPIEPVDTGATRAATGATPIGFLDRVTTTQIGGWAYQSDIPNTALQVHIYIINNSTGEQSIIPVTAGGYRADLENAGYGNGYHAFKYDINWKIYKPATYTVRAYAIGVNSSNPQLSYSPKSFTVRAATGRVDGLSSWGISGWAWKPDAPDLTINVHVYIYKLDGTQVALYGDNAWHPRPDLEAAGYGDGDHGFEIEIDWETLPKEELRVVVFAVDGSGYNPSFYDGYYNNAPPHGEITLYGIKFENEPSRSVYYTNNVSQAINNISVTAINGIYNGSSASTGLNRMKTSMIWVIHTHGWKQGVIFNNSQIGETYLEYSNIEDLPDGALNEERCVIYGICNAGEGGEGAKNMVNITHQKGAMTVIGWKDATYVPQVNTWLEEFLVSSGEGNTITQAKNDAIEAVKVAHKGDLGGLADEDTYIMGSTTQKLIS